MAAAATRYTDPRAHELRERYLATYGGDEVPVPVESIAEDLLGLRIAKDDLGDCSGTRFEKFAIRSYGRRPPRESPPE